MGQSDGGGPRTNLASASEDAVIELARLGNMPAFEELVRRRQQQLRQLLRRLCNDASLADDLCQETFVRAWQSLPSLRVNAAFWSWLRRIAARTWMQHAQRERRTSTMDMNSINEAGESLVGEHRDIDAGLARLAPAARACMVLAYQAGLTHSEIADALNLPLGTVKTHITRSTQALRHWLGAEQQE